MIEKFIFKFVDDEYKDDLKFIFESMENLDSQLLLSINLYLKYILEERGYII